MCQFIVLAFNFNFLLGVFITKKTYLVIFNLNISSSNFELFVLASYQVSTHTEIYF